jgi:hypothetical protein
MTGKDRTTVDKALEGMPFNPGPRRAKLYDTRTALPRIYYGASSEEGDKNLISEGESRRRLNIKRGDQIDLDMQVTRRERIPLAVCEEIDERTFSNIAGVLKGHEGKTLSPALLTDLYTELRQLGQGVREWKPE